MDWTIRFGDVLVVISMIAAAFAFTYKAGSSTHGSEIMKEDIVEIQNEMKKITAILQEVALQKLRMDVQSDRMNALEKQQQERFANLESRQAERLSVLEKRLYDLQRGQGFIVEPGRNTS